MIGSHFAGLPGSHGVELRTGVGMRSVRRVDADDPVATAGSCQLVVELNGGEVFPADVVVVGIGVAPTTDWLAGSGLTIDNGVVCDDRLFAADGIVAAGDDPSAKGSSSHSSVGQGGCARSWPSASRDN